MITAPPGYTVSVKSEYGDGARYPETVIAFNDDGEPLIAGRRGLTIADGELNEPEADIANAIPAEPGWYAVFASHLGKEAARPSTSQYVPDALG